MRPDHKSSSCFQKGLKTRTEVEVFLEAVQEAKLIHKYRSQHEALRGRQSFHGNLPMFIENTLKCSLKFSIAIERSL